MSPGRVDAQYKLNHDRGKTEMTHGKGGRKHVQKEWSSGQKRSDEVKKFLRSGEGGSPVTLGINEATEQMVKTCKLMENVGRGRGSWKLDSGVESWGTTKSKAEQREGMLRKRDREGGKERGRPATGMSG